MRVIKKKTITFIALFDRDDIPEAVRTTLAKAAPLIARGARPQTSPLPLTREVNMRNPFSFAAFPSWKRVFEDKSKAAQAAVYRDAQFRAFFFQAEDGIRDADVTGVQTCALPICRSRLRALLHPQPAGSHP